MRRVLLCALLLGGCQHRTPPRLLHMQVAVGPQLRQQTDWRDRVAGRVRVVARMLQPLGIQCELATVSEWEPDATTPLERNRRVLAGYHTSGDWIELGLYGSGQADGEPGLAVPFDSRALVFEVPGSSETQQAANMAHQIGHVLGAWHAHGGGSVMSLPPGSKLDDSTTSCLRLTRSLDLLQGPSSLDGPTVERLQELWAKAKEQPTSNPFYRFYSSRGVEEIAQELHVRAEEDFTKAERLAPGLARAHVDLGNAEMANHDYIEATEELRKALALDPGSNAAMSGLAFALIATGHREEGIETLVRSVKMNPGDSKAHANIGVVLAGTPGRMDEGIAELREAVRIDPGNASVQRSLDSALEARKHGRK